VEIQQQPRAVLVIVEFALGVGAMLAQGREHPHDRAQELPPLDIGVLDISLSSFARFIAAGLFLGLFLLGLFVFICHWCIINHANAKSLDLFHIFFGFARLVSHLRPC
jgi:hypothetical protein